MILINYFVSIMPLDETLFFILFMIQHYVIKFVSDLQQAGGSL